MDESVFYFSLDRGGIAVLVEMNETATSIQVVVAPLPIMTHCSCARNEALFISSGFLLTLLFSF